MTYTGEMSSATFRKVKKMNQVVKEEVVSQAKRLSKNQDLGERLRGKYKKLRSLHFVFVKTDYRIIYLVDKKSKVVLVLWVGTRENLYKELDRLKLRL